MVKPLRPRTQRPSPGTLMANPRTPPKDGRKAPDTGPPARAPLPDGTEINGYRISRLLGAGGFALTYLARPVTAETKDAAAEVVLKEFAPLGGAERQADGVTLGPTRTTGQSGYQSALDTFVAEAQTLAALGHPSIIGVEQFFRANGTAYFIMPFVPGPSLQDLVRQEGPVEETRLHRLTNQLLDALGAMHRRDFLHRDIKPDNILIGPGDRPVLIDFGSARLTASAAPDPMHAIGSAGYAAIEQYDQKSEHGPWTDIYGLSATLYFAVTGETPRPADARRDGETLTPATERGLMKYNQALLAAIDDGLSMEPSLRPQSVAEFRRSLTGDRSRSRLRRTLSDPGRRRRLGGWALAGGLIATVGVVALLLVMRPDAPPAAPAPQPQVLNPGDRFRDCADCPFMIVLPAPTPPPGAPPEVVRRLSAVPKRLAVGIHEVTRAEYAVFVGATKRPPQLGCRTEVKDGIWKLAPEATWQRPGFEQTSLHPVVCVSWHDAQAYVSWLRERTGKPYRLPSPLEWEYAARAGSQDAFAWGPTQGVGKANCKGCGSRWDGAGTAPIGSFTRNAFGLHDMQGNVAEWSATCATDVKEGGFCAQRLTLGGNWAAGPKVMAFGRGQAAFADVRYNRVGFRVVLELK